MHVKSFIYFCAKNSEVFTRFYAREIKNQKMGHLVEGKTTLTKLSTDFQPQFQMMAVNFERRFKVKWESSRSVDPIVEGQQL